MKEVKRVKFEQFAREPSAIFDAIAREKVPVLIERNGELYRIEPEGNGELDDLWAGYDPEQVRQAVGSTAGSWADLDAEALIADLYRAREEGSRPADRP